MKNKTESPDEKMLNSLLVAIVTSAGGTVQSNDKISLLKSWLKAVKG